MYFMKKSYLGYKDKFSAQLFLACWTAYFSTYICRLNFSVAMPEIIKSNILNEAEIATVSSAFFICYGAGQLFSGRLGDILSPKKMIFAGTFISALSNILIFFFYQSHAGLILLWGLNGIVQSLVWSPILRIAGDYFNGADREKFGTDISTTVTLGTLTSYGIGLLTLLFLPWHYVFLTCGICTLAASAIWILMVNRLRIYKNKPARAAAQIKSGLTIKPFIKLFIFSGCLILLIPIAIQGTLKDSVTQWMPTFFDDRFHLGTDISIILTMVLPVVNVTGAYIARAINKKLKNELKTSVVFFAVTLLFLMVLLFFGAKSFMLALLCVTVITTCMHAVNVMFITMVPLHFSKYSLTSTIGGLLNSVAYIGCGALNIAAGNVLNGGGDSSWNRLFVFWFIICAVAVILTAGCSIIWKKFLSSKYTEVKN